MDICPMMIPVYKVGFWMSGIFYPAITHVNVNMQVSRMYALNQVAPCIVWPENFKKTDR